MPNLRRIGETAPKILVVDDEPSACDFLEEFLNHRGYHVSTAGNGEEALERVRADPPHLMLLDIRMAGMSGFEVLAHAVALDPRLGVIVISAVQEENIARRALEAGACDYIAKPIDLGHLESVMMARIADVLD